MEPRGGRGAIRKDRPPSPSHLHFGRHSALINCLVCGLESESEGLGGVSLRGEVSSLPLQCFALWKPSARRLGGSLREAAAPRRAWLRRPAVGLCGVPLEMLPS